MFSEQCKFGQTVASDFVFAQKNVNYQFPTLFGGYKLQDNVFGVDFQNAASSHNFQEFTLISARRKFYDIVKYSGHAHCL